jgi:hypothetical protein
METVDCIMKLEKEGSMAKARSQKFEARSLKSGVGRKDLEIKRSIIKQFLFIFLIVLTNVLSKNLSAQCKPQLWSFQAGEELYYDIVYNWGFIWVDAGKVEFKAKKEMLDGREVFHFSGTGTSLPKHDWFFKVRDYFHSWAEISDLKPVKHIRNTSEGKYKADEKYSFDYSKQKIYSDVYTSKKPRKQDSLKLTPCLFDVMTAVYYARTFDLDNYKVNQKIPLSMIIDNEIYNLYGRFLGSETIKTREKKNINCLKFSIKLIEGTMFKGGEDLHVWISDDVNRVPILIEAEVLVGSVKAFLKDTRNLLSPTKY